MRCRGGSRHHTLLYNFVYANPGLLLFLTAFRWLTNVFFHNEITKDCLRRISARLWPIFTNFSKVDSGEVRGHACHAEHDKTFSKITFFSITKKWFF